MAYNKTKWENGKTPLNETNLNNIEEGIETVDALSTNNENRIDVIEEALKNTELSYNGDTNFLSIKIAADEAEENTFVDTGVNITMKASDVSFDNDTLFTSDINTVEKAIDVAINGISLETKYKDLKEGQTYKVKYTGRYVTTGVTRANYGAPYLIVELKEYNNIYVSLNQYNLTEENTLQDILNASNSENPTLKYLQYQEAIMRLQSKLNLLISAQTFVPKEDDPHSENTFVIEHIFEDGKIITGIANIRKKPATVYTCAINFFGKYDDKIYSFQTYTSRDNFELEDYVAREEIIEAIREKLTPENIVGDHIHAYNGEFSGLGINYPQDIGFASLDEVRNIDTIIWNNPTGVTYEGINLHSGMYIFKKQCETLSTSHIIFTCNLIGFYNPHDDDANSNKLITLSLEFGLNTTATSNLGKCVLRVTENLTQKDLPDYNIEKGSGNGAVQMESPYGPVSFSFLDNNRNSLNPHATSLDQELIDENGYVQYGASGDFSFAVGVKASAQGERSMAQGAATIAKGDHSHAEGENSVALGNDSHAEGYATTSYGVASHAEGAYNVARGQYSHVSGMHNEASHQAQTVIGVCNDVKENTLFEVGNGSFTDNGDGTQTVTNRQNAFEVYRDGHAEVQIAGATDKSVINRQALNEVITNINEKLEGKKNAIILSYNWDISYLKTLAATNEIVDADGNNISQAITNGEYNNITIRNIDFDSNEDKIPTSLSNYYLILVSGQYGILNPGTKYVLIEGVNDGRIIEPGYVILVIEKDVPDRWLAGYSEGFYALETRKIDLSASAISFDNSITELPNNIQGAIDNLYTKVENNTEDLDLKKANKDGYYSQLHSGLADNLASPDGVVNEEPYVFRSTAGSSSVSDGYATINKLKGNTLVFNQLINNNFSSGTINGVTFTNNKDGSWTVNGTATADTLKTLTNVISNPPDHIYYLKGCPTGGSAETYQLYEGWTSSIIDRGEGIIKKLAGNFSSIQFMISIKAGTTVENLVFKPQFFDLTLMFGEGNEPTSVEEFKALFPNAYYPYNQGELIHANIQGIRTIGFNACDKLENGGLTSSGGIDPDRTYLKTSNFIKVIPNSNYTFSIQDRNSVMETYHKYVHEYDENFNHINRQVRYQSINAPASFVVGNKTKYVKLEMGALKKSYSFIPEGLTVCFHLTWSGYRDGEYEEHWSETRDIIIPSIFESGMKSAGSVYDELTPTKAIKRIGTYTFTENEAFVDWEGIGKTLTVEIPNMKAVDSYGTIANVSWALGTRTSVVNINNSTEFTIAVAPNGRLYIATTKTNVELASALAGQTICYELATPIEEDLEQTRDVNWNYRISDFGTEEFLQAEGLHAPMKHETFYMRNLRDYLRGLGWAFNVDIANKQVGIEDLNGGGILITENGISYYNAKHNWEFNLIQHILDTNDLINTMKESNGGTLRQVLANSKSIDFNKTAWVDLGTLDWAVNSSTTVPTFEAQLPTATKDASYSKKANIICSKYETKSGSEVNNQEGKGIAVLNPTTIALQDTSFADVVTLKRALQGVILAYELEE